MVKTSVLSAIVGRCSEDGGLLTTVVSSIRAVTVDGLRVPEGYISLSVSAVTITHIAILRAKVVMSDHRRLV